MTSERPDREDLGKAKGNGRSQDRPILQDAPDFKALFPLRRCLSDDGVPADDPGLAPELLRKLMRYMIWNRIFDDRLTTLQRQGRIGFHIGSVGEEGLMIGTAAAIEARDWVVPCYREAGVALYRGTSLESLVHNMFGTADDLARGRQMPCHWADRRHNILSISSPVGTQISHATGIAWAMKLRGTKEATVVYFGDGATSTGDFHNGLNFAGVYRAPCVFVCRNNQWAISTPLAVQTAAETIVQKSVAYGVRGERVDGNDILACYVATRDALARARSGEGPTLLEMCTYRQGAHSTSDDPRAYREDREVEEWKRRDPIALFRKYLSGRGLWSEPDEQAAREEFERAMTDAIAAAERAPRPPIPSMFEDVYHDRPWWLVEQERDLAETLAEGYVPDTH